MLFKHKSSHWLYQRTLQLLLVAIMNLWQFCILYMSDPTSKYVTNYDVS
jgi:hypothetical protein